MIPLVFIYISYKYFAIHIYKPSLPDIPDLSGKAIEHLSQGFRQVLASLCATRTSSFQQFVAKKKLCS